MRLSLTALAAVLFVSPAMAENPQGTTRPAVEAIVIASLVQGGFLCPTYRINGPRLAQMLKDSGMTVNEMQERFPAYSHDFAGQIVSRYMSSPTVTCNDTWDLYGSDGTLSRILEKRD